MPAHDVFHDAVKHGLIKEGWTITDDPLIIEFGGLRRVHRPGCREAHWRREERANASRWRSRASSARRGD